MDAADQHIMWLMLLSVISIGATIVLAYMSKWQAALTAIAAFVLAKVSGYCPIEMSSLMFWLGAILIVLGIHMLLPKQVRDSRVGISYFCTGALVGASVGMLLNSEAGIITASAVGVVLGAIAFSRLEAGRQLDFPSRRFFNYLCAKGLPIVVYFSMIGILCLMLISGS